MKSRTTESFRKLYRGLPEAARRDARQAYRQWMRDPSYPSLQFKRVSPVAPIFSARVGLHWRVVGTLRDDVLVWWWIGSHADYDRLVKRARKGR